MGKKKSGDFLKKNSQLLIPVIALAILVIFNLFRDPSFFSIELGYTQEGSPVLLGNLISILDNASELVILAMGMTLVTAACGGQDISVGAQAAIAGSVLIKVIKSVSFGSPWSVIVAIIVSVLVTVLFASLNGTLVSLFHIQPMIATLILFTCGRSIAYWINGGATPTINNMLLNHLGTYIPGCPIPTSIIIVAVVGGLLVLTFKTTTIGLYTQTVGINQGAARLNGINPTRIKMLSFIILGVCCALAGMMGVSRLGLINHDTLMSGIEMDAILAVAVGGNSLGGGKFNMVGSIIGAYVIQTLTITLYSMKVPSTDIQAYKAIVIILLVVLGSPVVKEAFRRLSVRIKTTRTVNAGKGVA